MLVGVGWSLSLVKFPSFQFARSQLQNLVPIIKNGLDTVKMYESIVETSDNSNEEEDGHYENYVA